jgi:hypothetical protein
MSMTRRRRFAVGRVQSNAFWLGLLGGVVLGGLLCRLAVLALG